MGCRRTKKSRILSKGLNMNLQKQGIYCQCLCLKLEIFKKNTSFESSTLLLHEHNQLVYKTKHSDCCWNTCHLFSFPYNKTVVVSDTTESQKEQFYCDGYGYVTTLSFHWQGGMKLFHEETSTKLQNFVTHFQDNSITYWRLGLWVSVHL